MGCIAWFLTEDQGEPLCFLYQTMKLESLSLLLQLLLFPNSKQPGQNLFQYYHLLTHYINLQNI